MFSLRSLVSLLRSQGSLVDIFAPVDPSLEIAEIHRRVLASGGPALLFHHVIGSSFPVLTNLFGTQARVDTLFAAAPGDLIAQVVELASSPPSLSSLWKKKNILRRGLSLGLRNRWFRRLPLHKASSVNLNQLPLLTSWPEDGGAFLTLPLVYTESPNTGIPNLGMYRMQRFDQRTFGLHFQIQKGGAGHFYEAEQLGQDLPVTVFLSGNPFLILSAIAPLPENVPELLFCSFLQGKKLSCKYDTDSHHPLLFDAEFIFTGKALAGKRRMEGPFGDHFGYYSLQHPFPEFTCNQIYHKKHAIYPATVVGKPFQEDFYIGNKLQEYLSPLFPMVMPGIRSLKSYGEAGFHALTAAVVKERYWKESLATALRILGEGQLSLTKFLFVTDQPVDLSSFSSCLETILARCLPKRDLLIFSDTANDTLDYSGPALNKGSKAIFLGTGEPIRDLPQTYRGNALPYITDIGVFCPGCLVAETENPQKAIEMLLHYPNIASWPFIVLTDSLSEMLSSLKDFLWRTFTHTAPATDLYCNYSSVQSHKLHYQVPIILDAVIKPTYPKEVEVDERTAALVSKRWKEYGIPLHS